MAGSTTRVTIIGGGLSGPLMGMYLARRGFQVDIYERRGDMRKEWVEAGKSIKLTLAERGLHALRELGLEDEVKEKCCVPLRGRAVHSGKGDVAFIPYGKDDREVIWCFSRTDLNSLLLDRAEEYPGIRIHFHKKCIQIDKETSSAVFQDDKTGEIGRAEADFLIGADGAFSTVRQQMQRGERADYRQDFLPWAYKELTILGGGDGRPQMDVNALHIWPCGDHMLFALPNMEGSFNGVCCLPLGGEHSFNSIRTGEDVVALFKAHFGDALVCMPNIVEEYESRPISDFLTIRTSRWYHRGRIVLVGDAAHTVVPFYGQGMNCAFEDCSILDKCLERHGEDREAAFAEYQALRKHNADTLADLSIENFDELRDTVRRPIVAARKRMSIFLNRLLGQRSIPVYTMVSHSNLPYSECVARHRRQERIARWLGLDLVVGVVTFWVYLRNLRARRRALRQRAAEEQRPAARAVAAPPALGDARDRKAS